jgi:FG-GAP repeat protein
MRPAPMILSLLIICSSAASVSAAERLAPTSGPDWDAEGGQQNGWLGYSVATAGDVNGDGYADVIAGAYRYDANGIVDSGIAWAYYGSASGPSTTPNWTDTGSTRGEFFGHSVATAGDVNGDGFSDVIIGAPNPTHGDKFGLAYAFYGSPSGLSATPNWTVKGEQAVGWFGRTVRTAGDVNGDGFDDVVVGAPQWDDGETDEGKAWAYLGSASGLSTTASWTAESDQAGSWFGRWISLAGDVNADGYGDIIVDAHLYDDGQRDEGKVWAYYGSPSGLPTTADWSAEGNQAAAWFGRAIGPAGDVDADGYADIIVGAPFYTNGELHEGRAFVFKGSATGLADSAVWTGESDQQGAMYGRAVWTAGDANADGYDDVIVGAPNFDKNNQVDSGKTFAYYGSPSGPSTAADWTAGIAQARAWFGRSVSTAGDVNGDGFDDAIVGAPQFDHGEKDEGRVWVFYGSPTGLA